MTKKRFSPKSRNAVVVLGMHRSGTSALAGVLARLGCDLPQTLRPGNNHNAKGYYESQRLCEMNGAILHSGGAQWDDWKPFNPDWEASHRAEEFLVTGSQTLTEEYGTSRMFVLKDPRMCVLMPFWNRLLDQEEITPTYIHIHRNPIDVATSLQNRNGLPLTYGVLLWLRHVLDAELGSRMALRCFTSYDLLLENWVDVITHIKAETGLVFSRTSDNVSAEISAFLAPDMNSGLTAHTTSHDLLLSKWAGLVFEVLERWATQGEDPTDFATFDEVRAEMDSVAPLFGTLIRDARAAADHKTALEAASAELESLRTQTTTQHKEMQRALDKSTKKKKALRKALVTQQAAYDEAHAQQIAANQAVSDLDAQLTTATQELEQLTKSLTEIDQEKWQLQSELTQRISETVDMARQNTEHAAQNATLIAQIEELKNAQALQSQESEQLKKSGRMMRINLQKELEQKLQETLMQNRKNSEKMHLDLANTQVKQHQRIAELEGDNWALRHSTSWKITKPLRSLALLLRPR